MRIYGRSNLETPVSVQLNAQTCISVAFDLVPSQRKQISTYETYENSYLHDRQDRTQYAVADGNTRERQTDTSLAQRVRRERRQHAAGSLLPQERQSTAHHAIVTPSQRAISICNSCSLRTPRGREPQGSQHDAHRGHTTVGRVPRSIHGR